MLTNSHIINTEQREEYLKKFFTNDGVKALELRLNSLAKEYCKDGPYPRHFDMLGFVRLDIASKAHLEGMMENLRQILGIKLIEVK